MSTSLLALLPVPPTSTPFFVGATSRADIVRRLDDLGWAPTIGAHLPIEVREAHLIRRSTSA